jgi:type VI protein secretion system component VasF
MEEEDMTEEGEAERRELRVGLKAVLRRRREPEVLRSGVKDWKRLVRLGEEGMVAVVVFCCGVVAVITVLSKMVRIAIVFLSSK